MVSRYVVLVVPVCSGMPAGAVDVEVEHPSGTVLARARLRSRDDLGAFLALVLQ